MTSFEQAGPVVALAQPGEVLPGLLMHLSGILACSLLAPLLLYAAVRYVGLARTDRTLWWLAAALALLACGAAVLSVTALTKDFVDPGSLQGLAKVVAGTLVVVGVVLGCCLAGLTESRRDRGAIR